MQTFESEITVTLNSMRQAIERQVGTEDMFYNHVKNMEQELKRIDLNFEMHMQRHLQALENVEETL